MRIHRLSKSTFGSGGSNTQHRGMCCKHMTARCVGSGISSEIFDLPVVGKATQTLRNLNIQKPRMAKKYITLE